MDIRLDVGSPLLCDLEPTLSWPQDTDRENRFTPGLSQLLLKGTPAKHCWAAPFSSANVAALQACFHWGGRIIVSLAGFQGLQQGENTQPQLGRILLLPLPREGFPSFLVPPPRSPRSLRWLMGRWKRITKQVKAGTG